MMATPSPEHWDVYTVDRIPTGRSNPRGTRLEPGEYRNVVHVCVFDVSGRMLIQKRAEDKSQWPGLWDFSVGGSVVAGENSRQGAQRETREELGITLDLADRAPQLTLTYPNVFDDFYLVTAGQDCPSFDLADLAVPNDEVTHVRWATRDEVFELRAAHEFIGWEPPLIDFLFAAAASPAVIDPAW